MQFGLFVMQISLDLYFNFTQKTGKKQYFCSKYCFKTAFNRTNCTYFTKLHLTFHLTFQICENFIISKLLLGGNPCYYYILIFRHKRIKLLIARRT